MNSELADTLGNLLSRACAKVVNVAQVVPPLHQHEFEELLKNTDTSHLIEQLDRLRDVCTEHYDAHNFYLAVDEIIKVLHAANRFVEVQKPWELRKTPEGKPKLETVLRIAFETLRVCGILLQPIVPDTSAKLLDKLNVASSGRYWTDATVHFKSISESVSIDLGHGDAILFRRIK